MGKVVAAAFGLPTGKKFYAVIIFAKHVTTPCKNVELKRMHL
jgi:hypothetical protein